MKRLLYIVIHYKDEKDKIKNKWISTGLSDRGNKKEAKLLLDSELKKFEKEFEASKLKIEARKKPKVIDKSASTVLFSAYIEKDLTDKRKDLSPPVYVAYTYLLTRIKSFFDERNLRVIDVTTEDITDFYDHLREEGLKNVTLKHYSCLIRPALRKAFEDKLIPDNPYEAVPPIPKEHPPVNFYDKSEMAVLFKVIREKVSEPVFKLAFKLAAYYGFRRSEILGLKWKAIDFEHKLISVNHKAIFVDKDFYLSDTLKNTTSRRTLPLIPSIEQDLLAFKAFTEKNKEFYGNTYNREYQDYVFVKENGELIKSDHLSKKFSDTLKANKLRVIRLHDLRHSCASNMLANGVQMKIIQEWLGHAHYGTTADVYSHLDFSSKIVAADTIASVYGEKTKPAAEIPQQDNGQDTMSIYFDTLKEMRALGIMDFEEYLKYKFNESQKEPKENTTAEEDMEM